MNSLLTGRLSSSHVTSTQSCTISWHVHTLWTLYNSVQQRGNFLTKPSYKSDIINSQNSKSVCNFSSECFQHSITSCMRKGQNSCYFKLGFHQDSIPKRWTLYLSFPLTLFALALWLLHRHKDFPDFYFQTSLTTPIYNNVRVEGKKHYSKCINRSGLKIYRYTPSINCSWHVSFLNM